MTASGGGLAGADDVPEGSSVSSENLSERQARYTISPELFTRFAPSRMAAQQGTQASVAQAEPKRLPVVIELNLDRPGGSELARSRILERVEKLGGEPRDLLSRRHVFATLSLEQIQDLVQQDEANGTPDIFKIWPDRPLEAFLDRSARTIKADACIRSFGSDGLGIVWAVIDSGIDGTHPHFATYATLDLGSDAPNQLRGVTLVGLDHRDYTGGRNALSDPFGHGTHVAGIIAGATPHEMSDGEVKLKAPGAKRIFQQRNSTNNVRLKVAPVDRPLVGIAPRCKLISLKVLDAEGAGSDSALLAALDEVARWNEDGRRIRVHGVNISIGYPYSAEWFAAGQSPICVEVNRLVRTGVVVVVAAGNDGSVMIRPDHSPSVKRIGLDQSIADPGNADLAITVGSTHAEAPHTYGVSYFSSRGPTTDGRPKPDLVAPGERILSCASSVRVAKATTDNQLDVPFEIEPGVAYYREDTGTSMATPHVSGAAAALLSARREFIGQPERVKDILVSTATDLKRRRDFQGAGLVDLMRAMQSI